MHNLITSYAQIPVFYMLLIKSDMDVNQEKSINIKNHLVESPSSTLGTSKSPSTKPSTMSHNS